MSSPTPGGEQKSGGYFGTAGTAVKTVLYNTGAFACASYTLKALVGPQTTRQALRAAVRTGPGAVAVTGAVIAGSQLIDSLGNPEFVGALGSMADKLPNLRSAGADADKFRDFVVNTENW